MLVKIFEEQVHRNPSQIAVKTSKRSLTYGELNRTANQVAHAMIQTITARPATRVVEKDHHRIPFATPGQDDLLVVGLLFEHGVDMIIGLVSAIKAGYVYVPLDPNYPEQRLGYMIENAEISLIITNTQNQALAQQLTRSLERRVEILNIETISDVLPADRVDRPALTSEIAYILYTSGSTGVPKGVVQSHENIWHFIRNYISDYGITSKDRLTLFSAFSHDAAVMDIYSGLLSGATLYPLNLKHQVNLADLTHWLQQEEITIYHSVPTVYRYFTKMLTGEERFPHLRWMILGGEGVLRHDVVTYMQRFEPHTTLVNLYGQSESSYNAAQFIEQGRQVEKITLGRTVEDCEIWVVNEEHEETADFEIGEIIVACDHIALGYWRDPERTEQVFIHSPEAGRLYRTGDLGRRLIDGTVEFVGRKDFQVKVRGYRVDLNEIESRLLEHPAIDEAVVLAKDDPDGNKWLCGYVVAKEEITETRLKGYLSESLPDYMVPTRFVYLDHLPVTPTNKIDRNALPEPSLGNSEESVVIPRNLQEARIRQVWADVLRLDESKISVNTSFFDLGGNSLSVMSLATLLSREFQKNVRIPDLFRHPTVEMMADFLEKTADENATMDPIQRVNDAEWYPVSSAQQRMFILNQLEGHTTAYNLPMVLRMEYRLDQTRFREALEALVQRHEALRTSFHFVGEELVQKVHPTVELPLEMYTLEGSVSRGEVEAMIGRMIRPFDVSLAPLFRVGLVQWGDEQVLLFDIHHIISDGTSNDLLVTEFLRLYTGEVLPELSIQYRDFAFWQRKTLASPKGLTQETYWIDQFAPERTRREIPILNLPTDFPRPVQQSFEGARFQFEVNPELTASLHELARRNEATLFMVLLSTYHLLLAKYTGQEDIIIGSPVAGRPQPELNHVIGMFVNTLALRSFPEGSKPFWQYLREIREGVLQALESQDYPFEMLVSKLKLKRDTGRNPLFDTSFRLQNFQRSEVVVNDIILKPFTYANPVSQFDLQLTCHEVGQGIRCNFEYATRLFQEETIRAMAAHFIQLLNEVVKAPERQICEIAILSNMERKRLLEEWNATDTPYPREMTIHQLFEAQAAATPDAIALVVTVRDTTHAKSALVATDGDAAHDDESVQAAISHDAAPCVGSRTVTWTYSALNERANQLARSLRGKGVQRESVVGLMVSRSAELILGMIAVMKAGGTYLPIDPDYPADRIQYILDDSDTTLLLTESTLQKSMTFTGEQVFLDDPYLYTGDGSNLPPINQASDLLYLIYTSGSTGRPKGTMLEHRSVHNFITGMQKEIHFAPGKVIGSLTTASFDIFVLESLLPLTVGMKVVLASEAEQRDPECFHDLMIREQVEMIQLTPSRLQIFLDDPQASLVFAQMETILVGGEAFPERVLERLRAVTKANIYNMYGPTETTIWSTVAELTHADSVTIGRPITNTRIYILSPYLELVPPRVVGELYIGGEGLARGYYKQSELTAERFIADPWVPGERIYRTGDLARWLPDGRIEYMGRSDQQVKIRGYRIEVGEIETLLSQYPGIKDNVVVTRDGEDGFKYLVAYYVADAEIPVSALRQMLLQKLPDYMVPGIFQRLDALPQTPNGKIDRKALPSVDSQRPCLVTEYQAAETELQKKVAVLWSEVLKIETIGIHDNFFDLGGNSLLLVQLRQKLEGIWPGKVAVADLFAYPTIAKLTTFLESQAAAATRIEEAEAYWMDELGEEFTLLTLPDTYYETTGQHGNYHLRLHVPDALPTQLEQVAMGIGADLIDLTTGMYIFLLREISGQDQIIIEASLKDDPLKVFPLKVDLSEVEDLSILFHQIHEKYAKANELFHERLAARLRKRWVMPQVLPLFTTHPAASRRENDLVLVQHQNGDEWTWICEYNGNRLCGERVEELVDSYCSLLEILAQEYHNESHTSTMSSEHGEN